MSQLSVRAGASRKDRATGQLPLPRTMTLGPPTHVGSSLPGLVQTLAPSPEPQQAGSGPVLVFSGHKGCALPDSGPQVLGTPPHSLGFSSALPASRDMTAPGWGPERQARPRTPKPWAPLLG